MAMLLRTSKSKIALTLRVVCILTVFVTYAVIGVVTRGKLSSETGAETFDAPPGSSRHLLAVKNVSKNCTRPAIDDFPRDGFNRAQRQQGWIILHIISACYLFTLLAIVCDDYFVPAIKKVCDILHMKEDVAGATFMATASSSPELFINCVGTFVTEGDIGVGTIVGSAVFNILAVPACCGLFAGMVLDLEWWPISRDSVMYGISVILLITVLQDGKVFFYEALVLVLAYTLYVLHESTKIWEWPSEETPKGQVWWVITWPISFILYMTTPDCRKYPKMFIITFIMCIFWIGTTSYTLGWLITIVGDTFDVPDSVMGLTFLAAGTSVPEAVSSVIVTKQGHGAMGLSSSIGSNTFDILLCLGIPWLIKTAFYPKIPGNHYIQINSSGINFSAIALLSTLVMLYLSIALNKYRLDWKVGLTCLLMYVGFLIFASLLELNVFFKVNLPTCDR